MKNNFLAILCGIATLLAPQTLHPFAGAQNNFDPKAFEEELDPDQLRVMAKQLFPDMSSDELESVVNETLEYDRQFKALPPEKKQEAIAEMAEFMDAALKEFDEAYKEYEKNPQAFQQPAATKPAKAPEQKPAVARPSSEREKLKASLIALDSTVANLFLKLSSLLRVSPDAAVEQKWSQYRAELEDFIIMLKMIIGKDKLLDVMLSDDYKLLKSELLDLEKVLTPIVDSIQTADISGLKQDIAKTKKEASKKMVALAVDTIGKRLVEPKSTWSLKALIQKHDPEEAKKIPARAKEQAPRPADNRYPQGDYGRGGGNYKYKGGGDYPYPPYAPERSRGGGYKGSGLDTNLDFGQGGKKDAPKDKAKTDDKKENSKKEAQPSSKEPGKQKTSSDSGKKPESFSLKDLGEVCKQKFGAVAELLTSDEFKGIASSGEYQSFTEGMKEQLPILQKSVVDAQASYKKCVEAFFREFDAAQKDPKKQKSVVDQYASLLTSLTQPSMRAHGQVEKLKALVAEFNNTQTTNAQVISLSSTDAGQQSPEQFLNIKNNIIPDIQRFLTSMQALNTYSANIKPDLQKQLRQAALDQFKSKLNEADVLHKKHSVRRDDENQGITTKKTQINVEFEKLQKRVSDAKDSNTSFEKVFELLAKAPEVDTIKSLDNQIAILEQPANS